ncbi:DUF2391 family protein [Candidatus Woesearchaeota archaeon]|nr:DUF2391 family protein [Candidatus Woesearchaeota archaeon]
MKKQKKAGKTKPDSAISKKLDKLLEGQQELLNEEQTIELEEKETERKEDEVAALEKQQLTELEKLEQIEQEVREQVKQHPLTKITVKDIFRGSLGAFVGTTLHYTFLYGLKVAEQITMTRATIIYVLSFIMGTIFLYITGFRRMEGGNALFYLPIRMVVLYAVSMTVSVAVLLLFFPGFGESFPEVYKQVATVSLTAVIGACTADTLVRD